eukprot:31479-Pelagococcus_subviridis.AAC.15
MGYLRRYFRKDLRRRGSPRLLSKSMTASDFVTTYVPGSASAIYDVATGGEVDVNKRNHEDDLRCAT